MKGVPFSNKRYTKGVPFLEKRYIKGVGPWGGASPYKTLLSTHPRASKEAFLCPLIRKSSNGGVPPETLGPYCDFPLSQ